MRVNNTIKPWLNLAKHNVVFSSHTQGLAWLAVLWFFVLAVSQAARAEDGTTLGVLRNFERLYIADRPTPPDDIEQGWSPVELNDLWGPSRRAQHLEAWYRTDFQLTALPATELGIYIPRVSSIASIWLNGVEIGSTGSFDGPVSNAWNHPQLFVLPSSYINRGTNTLHIRLRVIESEMGMLFGPSIGAYDKLQPQFKRSHFLKVTASKILSLIMIVGVVVMAIFYVAMRLPSSYLWFIAGSVFWTVYSLELFVERFPGSYAFWDWLLSFSICAAVVCYFAAVVRMLGLKRHKIEWMLAILLVISPIGTLVLSPLQFSLFRFVYVCITAALTLFIALMLSYRGWQRREQEGSWMMATGAVIIALVCWDAVLFIFQITAEFAKFPYIPLVATLVGAGIFFRRIISLNTENESMRGTIQTVDNAISVERQRLLEEIHDGVGGQLVSTLAILQRENFTKEDIVDSVKTSLDDLRLIISSLEPIADYGDILGILATVRERLQQRLLQAGIELKWQVKTIADLPWFDATHALQLMRILQEAITNVLKHAGASTIVISCEEVPHNYAPGIAITVADDGVGIGGYTKSGAYGLQNMRLRATRLQGLVSVERGEVGTLVRLWLPRELVATETAT